MEGMLQGFEGEGRGMLVELLFESVEIRQVEVWELHRWELVHHGAAKKVAGAGARRGPRGV